MRQQKAIVDLKRYLVAFLRERLDVSIADAEDLAQDTLLRALEHARRRSHMPGHFRLTRAWAIRTAINLYVDKLRKRRGRGAQLKPAEVNGLHIDALPSSRIAARKHGDLNDVDLLELIERYCGERTATVVSLMAEGHTQRSAANRLNIAQQTIRRELARARRLLIDHIAAD